MSFENPIGAEREIDSDSDSSCCSSCGYRFPDEVPIQEINDCNDEEEKLVYVPMLLKQSAFSKITTSDAGNTFLLNSNFETIELISCPPEELKKGLIQDDVFSAILQASPSINDGHKFIILPKGSFRKKLWWELA